MNDSKRYIFMLKIVSKVLLMFLLSSCAKNEVEILERSDVQEFKVEEVLNGSKVKLTIQGLAFHSAMVVDQISAPVQDRSINVTVSMVLTKQDKSGSFFYELEIPQNVNQVTFGKNKVTIWHRRP